MKKRIFCCLSALLLLSVALCGCSKNEELTTVRVNEVTHSVFYAPLYLADSLGYFADENLKIELDFAKLSNEQRRDRIGGDDEWMKTVYLNLSGMTGQGPKRSVISASLRPK